MERSQVWVGAEPLRRHHVRAALNGDELSVDCAGSEGFDRVLVALNGGGLFTTRVRIVNLDALGGTELAKVAAAVGEGAGPVVAECDKLGAPAKRALAGVFDVQQVSLGRGSVGRNTIEKIGKLLGLRLVGPVADMLVERSEGEPGRAVGILEALAAGGFEKPSLSQVQMLLGTSGSPGMPWALLEHIERGQAGLVADLIGQVEVIPALGFLSKRVLAAAMIAEDPDLSDQDLDDLLGGMGVSAANAARRLGNRVGAHGCRRLVAVLAQADLFAKRGQPEAAMLLVVGHLSLELSAAR